MGILRKLAAAGAAVVLVGPAAGCDRGSGETVSVTSPAEGQTVTVPFEVTVEASVPLGPASEGVHHLHIWFDNDVDSYLVVEGGTVRVTNAPRGERVMHVSLRHANHTAAGAEVSVPLVISGDASQSRSANDY